jgi:hypothetical protein
MNASHTLRLDQAGDVHVHGVRREDVKVRLHEGWLVIHFGELQVVVFPDRHSHATPLDIADQLGFETRTEATSKQMLVEPDDVVECRGFDYGDDEPVEEATGGIVPSGDDEKAADRCGSQRNEACTDCQAKVACGESPDSCECLVRTVDDGSPEALANLMTEARLMPKSCPVVGDCETCPMLDSCSELVSKQKGVHDPR